jgi:hypothetical protein
MAGPAVRFSAACPRAPTNTDTPGRRLLSGGNPTLGYDLGLITSLGVSRGRARQ